MVEAVAVQPRAHGVDGDDFGVHGRDAELFVVAGERRQRQVECLDVPHVDSRQAGRDGPQEGQHEGQRDSVHRPLKKGDGRRTLETGRGARARA